MKIDSSTIGMESARSYQASKTTIRRFSVTEYQGTLTYNGNTLNSAVTGEQNQQSKAAAEEEKQEDTKTMYTLEDWQKDMGVRNMRLNIRPFRSNDTMDNLRQMTVRYIFELLFANRRNRLDSRHDEQGMTGADTAQEQTGSTDLLKPQNNQTLQMRSAVGATFRVFNYSEETIQFEQESTDFSTVGTVRTTDGREIQFHVNVGMSRQFQETFRQDLQLASFKMCDPLVINLDTDVAELSDQTFYFDIDADGEKDEVSMLSGRSGYLALDENGDGVINDGSELFGTKSGDGFADLARYDQDGNGWIDENDEVWSKLQIWCKDEKGQDVLYRLADKGVGAICLSRAATDFTLKGDDGRTTGAIRSTGVFLYENGNVGTVQHVDVAKYSWAQ